VEKGERDGCCALNARDLLKKGMLLQQGRNPEEEPLECRREKKLWASPERRSQAFSKGREIPCRDHSKEHSRSERRPAAGIKTQNVAIRSVKEKSHRDTK